MAEQSYVRTEMMAAQKPPGLQTGVVRWVRENLFSSWLNVLLTLLAFYAVYSILATIGPWFYRSVWTGNSLNECRATLAAKYGEGTYKKVLTKNGMFSMPEVSMLAIPATRAMST